MRTLCLNFQLHQPFRLKKYHFFDIGKDSYYYDDFKNKSIITKVAKNCYLPTNQVLLDLIKIYGDTFKVSFSISGLALDQLEMYAPEVIESFQKLAKTGNVEFIGELYAHSLASLISEEELVQQIKLYNQKIKRMFNTAPKVFRNTEMIYNDNIGEIVSKLGFDAIMTEGANHILGWKSPHFVYYNPVAPKLKILLRHYELSDDIAFRFSDRSWAAWPLTTEKYVSWLNGLEPSDKLVNLTMAYESFGEHHKADTGILAFLKALPNTLHQKSDFRLATPSEVIQKHTPKASLHIPDTISWSDAEKDLTAWLGNEMQEEAFEKLYKLQSIVSKIKDKAIQRDWLYLQASDHFFYMSTKYYADEEVHNYFNPYDSPYEAFINYMNILSDFIRRIGQAIPVDKADEILLQNGSKEDLEELIKKSRKALKQLQKEPLPKVKSSKEPSSIEIEKNIPQTNTVAQKPDVIK